MSAVVANLEHLLEAEDGVVEVARVMPHLTAPWASLKPGPRRWAPTDLSVEVVDDQIQVVRLTYRTVGDRSVVVAGAVPSVDLAWLAERLSTPLLFSHHRKMNASLTTSSIMASLKTETAWEDTPGDGWQFGTCGDGLRPVRLARRTDETGYLLVAAHGVATEEMTTILASLVPVTHGSEQAEELHVRHRRALAQRWWDAPRTPWTPED